MSRERVLHLDWSPTLRAYWIHRILTTLHTCPNQTIRERTSRWDQAEPGKTKLSDLAIAVATKLTVVPLIVQRVEARLQAIETALQSDWHQVESCLRHRRVYPFPDQEAGFQAIVDFDAFFFESRSAYEITLTFLGQFFEVILGKPLGTGSRSDTNQHIVQALRKRGASTNWIGELRKKRNLLIHERALWLALELADHDPFRFNAVLLTKNVEICADDPDRLSIEECRCIWREFTDSYRHIEAWLREEIENAGT